ncbi:hypothetical protein B0H63DRAFT_488428 [Podospora didyma]|uniref:Zn(2)-C6 fungal-type domain-containing protein n=1 Tax=Podospora didyma TaxID=330526 RepID=A0AAE0K2Z3_9PEZI|nr:hypothetical protein B0H63DRAFT_488428 [Podospora didyma]
MPRKHNPQNRLACDRCHSQKLRCQRQEGQGGGCQRCTRANATCVFSPRQRRVTACPPQPSPEQQQLLPTPPLLDETLLLSDCQHDTQLTSTSVTQLPAESLHLDFSAFDAIDPGSLSDWSGLLAFGSPPNLSSGGSEWEDMQIVDTVPSLSPDSSADTDIPSSVNDFPAAGTTDRNCLSPEELDPIPSSVRLLADLNVRLYEHAETLPPLPTAAATAVPSPPAVPSRENTNLFAIDETFHMTQALIDVVNRLYPSTPTMFSPDQSTVLLLLSCANRVFDIYQVMISHMRFCLLHKITPVGRDGKGIRLPQLRIGTFAPPTPAALTMHMLMVILMASNLFDQLQEVLGVWRQSNKARPVRSSHDPVEIELAVGKKTCFPDFTEDAKSEVVRRAGDVAGEIVSTRELLLSKSGLKGGASSLSKSTSIFMS